MKDIDERPRSWSLWELPGGRKLLLTVQKGVKEDLVLASPVDVQAEGDELVAVSRGHLGTEFTLSGDGDHAPLLAAALANHLDALEIDPAEVRRLGHADFSRVTAPAL
jgi:hypothetical protein